MNVPNLCDRLQRLFEEVIQRLFQPLPAHRSRVHLQAGIRGSDRPGSTGPRPADGVSQGPSSHPLVIGSPDGEAPPAAASAAPRTATAAATAGGGAEPGQVLPHASSDLIVPCSASIEIRASSHWPLVCCLIRAVCADAVHPWLQRSEAAGAADDDDDDDEDMPPLLSEPETASDGGDGRHGGPEDMEDVDDDDYEDDEDYDEDGPQEQVCSSRPCLLATHTSAGRIACLLMSLAVSSARCIALCVPPSCTSFLGACLQH